MACADDALARARAEGIDWLLHLDPDEFAWGGPLEHDGSTRAAGDLRAMLARVAPRTEMVTLRTLEAVPVRRPTGTPFWTQHAMLADGAIVRDVLDPWTGRMTQLGRCLGHVLGKSVARVAADLQSASAHRWTRRQGVAVPAELPVASEELGVHFHYVVRDGAHWLAKYRQLSTDPDVWLRGIAMEFPKLSWKKAAAVMSREDAERYFDEWVAVPDEIVARHRATGGVIVAPHVERVLDEIGFTRTAPSRRVARRCRVAFVGVDACDPDLVDAWAADGTLPTFRRLLDHSLIADTEPPPGFFVGAIWPSLWTAVGPGRHGVHCWEQLVPGTYDVRRFLAGREVALRPFWRTSRRRRLPRGPARRPALGSDAGARRRQVPRNRAGTIPRRDSAPSHRRWPRRSCARSARIRCRKTATRIARPTTSSASATIWWPASNGGRASIAGSWSGRTGTSS